MNVPHDAQFWRSAHALRIAARNAATRFPLRPQNPTSGVNQYTALHQASRSTRSSRARGGSNPSARPTNRPPAYRGGASINRLAISGPGGGYKMKHGRQFRGSEMNVKRHQNQHFIRTNKQQRTTFLSGEWKRPIHEKKRNHFGGPAHGEADACR